jgi:FSR family fosmidomycin resistance protein-like MFS transporter
VQRFMSFLRPAAAGRGFLLAALAVVLVDELADGIRGAALPLIRQSLALTYPQIGLLLSVPLVLGGLLELPLGVLSGRGAGRRRAVLGGGVVFAASLAAVAWAGSFGWLLAAFVVFFPASGAFVGLTQAELMDAAPARRAQHLARWTLAGSLGAVAGPLLLGLVLAAAGGNWRTAYLVLAAAAALAWLAMARAARRTPARTGRPEPPASSPEAAGSPDVGPRGGLTTRAARVREAIGVLRRGGALRWLTVLQVSDLLLDVLTGFVALYLVQAAGATPAQAALGVAVRLGAGLAGDVLVVHVLERAGDLRVLRIAAVAAAGLYPAFLLVPGLAAKLVVLGALSMATASWYPILQARWYRSLPGHSDVAVSLESAATLAGGLAPAALGALAGWAGLPAALSPLALVPLLILTSMPRRPPGRPAQPPSRTGTADDQKAADW